LGLVLYALRCVLWLQRSTHLSMAVKQRPMSIFFTPVSATGLIADLNIPTVEEQIHTQHTAATTNNMCRA
jgi:hypothetical protein